MREELQEVHSAIEEAKADICGLYAIQLLIDKEEPVIEKTLEKSFYCTFLAGCFRSIRFGVHEAHGCGQALILNFLLNEGGFEFDEKKRKYSVNFGKVKESVKKLASEILTLQAEGSKEKAKKMIERFAVVSGHVAESLESVSKNNIPVDIRLVFPQI